MKSHNMPRVMLVSSMIIFGTIALFVRNIPLPSGEIALYRATLAIILIGAYLVIAKKKIHLSSIKTELPLLLASGCAMGINWILLFEAYKYTTVSNATLSYYFAPVIVIAVCPLLFKEKLGIKQIISFIMSSVGLVLITGIGVSSSESSGMLGIFLGIGAAVFYATVILLNKFIKGVDGINRTFLQFVAAVITLLPYVMITSGINIADLDFKGIGCLLIVGLLHTGITYCLYFSSLKEIPGQKAAILSYIDPLVAVIVSVTILGEPMTWIQVIGGGLILGFALWNEMPSKSNKKGRI